MVTSESGDTGEALLAAESMLGAVANPFSKTVTVPSL
jgi:hypothetical protein